MRRLIISALAAVAMAAGAVAADAAPTLAELLEQSGWTVEELLTGLERMDAYYQRAVQTESGRKAWHGALVSSVVDTNTMTKVTTYADGTRFTDKAKVRTAADAAAALEKRLEAARTAAPARLAAARARRIAEKAATNVVVVTVGGAQ